MRKISILLTAVLFLASSYAFAEMPATAGHERNSSRLPAGTPFVRGGIDQLMVMIALADYGTYEGQEVKDSLLSYGVADSVALVDARFATPTVAQMEPYDCVICWPNYTYQNATQFGDNLADYVDGGGAVVLPEFNFYSGWALGGRIMTAGYSPWPMTTSGGYEQHSLGWYDPTHPVMDGVTSGSAYFCFNVVEQGNVEDIAHYDNDYKLAAVSEDNPVGALNLYYGQSYARWTGDFMLMLGNMVLYVTGGGPEATMRCETLSPVFCRGKTFYFKLTVKNNTAGNISGTLTFSGYAGYDCDPTNSLVAIPRPKTYVPGETVEYYFFRVPGAVGPGQYSASVGGTLAGVDLFCCMNTDCIECSPFKVGENTEWGLEQVDRPEVALPTVTELHQNYPNPFNAQTNIGFSLSEAGNVSLKVYDLSGRLVASLVNGHLDAGEHVASWDASAVSSGVYFYKLSCGDYTCTKTMNLLR